MGVKPPAGEHESTVRQSILEKNERRVKDAAWEKKLAEQHTDLTNKFMSREDQLFFRGLTRVLQLTDILEARKAGDDLDLRNKTLNKTTPLYKIANRIVLNPTPREYDIAALTMGGYVEDASSIDFGNVQQPRLILTSNPESKDHLKLGRKPDEEEYPLRLLEKYAVDATDTKRYAGGIHEEAGKDIVTFVLGTFIECKILQSKQVPYPRHVGYYMELLKDCHKASSSEQLSIAGERSTDYVILTSYGKTLRRLNFGIGHRPQQRYLFDIITMPIEKLPERAHAIPCPSLENPSQEPNQRKMLQQCFAKISNYPAASRDALATQPVYDRKGRKRFHYMLAFRVIKLRTNLSDVREAIQAYVKAEYDHPAKVAKDRKKPKLLRDELRLLACLQTYFKDIVPAHMLWLAQVTGATNAKDFPLWSDNEPSTSSESQAPAKSSSPLPSLSIITSAGPTTAEEDQSLQKATVVAGDADNADDEDEELEKQGDPTLNRPGEGAFALWMRQASKWLSLVSQHDIGLLNAIPSSFEKRSERSLQMSKQIVAAEVVVVQLGTQDPDDKKMSINNCLEELGTRMTKAGNLGLDISKLKEIIKVQNGNRIRYEEKLMVAETFHIVPHADATAIALMACFEDHDVCRHLGGRLVDNETSALKEHLIRSMRRWLPLVDVTKRCCPACWRLIQLF